MAILFLPQLAQAQSPGLRTVQQVIYGDRIVLDNGETVQLLGVWAMKPDPGKKPFKSDSMQGAMERRSREFTQGLVLGKQVTLTYGTPAKDAYGNSLAFVYFTISGSGGGSSQVSLGAGNYMLNRLLVNYGYAEADDKADTPYRAEFEQLESEARFSKRGNWQMGF